jgi:putative hydrolase of the HAD superfamily
MVGVPRRRGGHGSDPDRQLPGPVRTVLFDLDDTLFDHSGALAEGIRALRAVEPMLRRRSLAALVADYQGLIDAVVPGVRGSPPTHGEARNERFRRLRVSLGGSDDLAAAREWSEFYREAYQAARRPVDGALPLLKALHGKATIGVVTNNHTLEQVGKLRHLGLERWIDFMVTSEDAGHSKPDARIFELALYRAACQPTEAIMVGDTWPTDIVGAATAGVPAVWLRRRPGRRPRGLRGVPEIRSFRPTPSVARFLLSGRTGPALRTRTVRPHPNPS